MTTTTTIRNAVEHIDAEEFEYSATRNDSDFISEVCLYLNDRHDINVAGSDHAHNVLCDELDKYFA